MFGVALTTAALGAAHGTRLVDGDTRLVDGFRAAVLVAAVVILAAAAVTWRRMPVRAFRDAASGS